MQEGCTVNLTVRYIARKWSLLILLELYKGAGHTRRFSELKSCLDGITQKVLSARLKELEKENQRLKRIVADQALDIDMLKYLTEGKF